MQTICCLADEQSARQPAAQQQQQQLSGTVLPRSLMRTAKELLGQPSVERSPAGLHYTQQELVEAASSTSASKGPKFSPPPSWRKLATQLLSSSDDEPDAAKSDDARSPDQQAISTAAGQGEGLLPCRLEQRFAREQHHHQQQDLGSPGRQQVQRLGQGSHTAHAFAAAVPQSQALASGSAGVAAVQLQQMLGERARGVRVSQDAALLGASSSCSRQWRMTEAQHSLPEHAALPHGKPYFNSLFHDAQLTCRMRVRSSTHSSSAGSRTDRGQGMGSTTHTLQRQHAGTRTGSTPLQTTAVGLARQEGAHALSNTCQSEDMLPPWPAQAHESPQCRQQVCSQSALAHAGHAHSHSDANWSSSHSMRMSCPSAAAPLATVDVAGLCRQQRAQTVAAGPAATPVAAHAGASISTPARCTFAPAAFYTPQQRRQQALQYSQPDHEAIANMAAPWKLSAWLLRADSCQRPPRLVQRARAVNLSSDSDSDSSSSSTSSSTSSGSGSSGRHMVRSAVRGAVVSAIDILPGIDYVLLAVCMQDVHM